MIRVWDLTSHQKTDLQFHGNWIRPVIWSPDGKRLASISDLESTIEIWDLATGQSLAVEYDAIWASSLV
jgi:WD40 repeat protein